MNEHGVLVFAELIIRVGMATGARDRVSGPVLAVPLTHKAVNEYSRIFIRSGWSHGFSISSCCFELRRGIRDLWSVKILNSNRPERKRRHFLIVHTMPRSSRSIAAHRLYVSVRKREPHWTMCQLLSSCFCIRMNPSPLRRLASVRRHVGQLGS